MRNKIILLIVIFLAVACQPEPPPRPAVPEAQTEAEPITTVAVESSAVVNDAEGSDHSHDEDSDHSHDDDHSHDEASQDGSQINLVAESAGGQVASVPVDICDSFIGNTLVTCTEDTLIVETNSIPEHVMMVGIQAGGWNGQFPVEQPYTGENAYHIHLSPNVTITPATAVRNAAGVAVNGVAIFLPQAPGRSGGENCIIELGNGECMRDPVAAGEMDICGGHTGRGNDYHYHQLTDAPGCLLDTIGEGAVAGIMLDGILVYQDPLEGSQPAFDCGGYVSPDGTYHYAVTEEFPYITNCLIGEFDLEGQPRSVGAEAVPNQNQPNGSITDFYIDENDCRVLEFSDGQTRSFCGNMIEASVPATTNGQGGDVPQGEDDAPAANNGDKPAGRFDFKAAAEKLGISEKALKNAMGQPPHDFKVAAETLGITVEALEAALESTRTTEEQLSGNDDGGTNNQTASSNTSGANSFKLEAWADNWFAAYLGDTLIVEDSVSINTERSFNAETVTFNADYPLNLNFILKDYKENDTGLEYIGANNQQMGDGGFIMQLTDTGSGNVVAASDATWACTVIHEAPLDKSCASEANPVAGSGACQFTDLGEPAGWKAINFDDSGWTATTVHSADAVKPKDGYDQISWGPSAQIIWGPDLETDNTVLCRVTIAGPGN